MASVAAIVLAAGASSRLGMPKQLVRLGEETLLERAVRVALEAGLRPVFGVVPADLVIDPLPMGMVSVVNEEAGEGMASSIRAGLRALGAEIDGAVLLACDQPAVTAGHLRELAREPAEVVASSYAGRMGVPVYFPRASFGALMRLRGDMGARDLIQGARAVPLFGGELDVDTLEELMQARRLYEG